VKQRWYMVPARSEARARMGVRWKEGWQRALCGFLDMVLDSSPFYYSTKVRYTCRVGTNFDVGSFGNVVFLLTWRIFQLDSGRGKVGGGVRLGLDKVDEADSGGMMIAAADVTREELEEYASSDPAVLTGLLTFKVKTWHVAMAK
jgi:hypothetical protein